jgi:hypothetical protein
VTCVRAASILVDSFSLFHRPLYMLNCVGKRCTHLLTNRSVVPLPLQDCVWLVIATCKHLVRPRAIQGNALFKVGDMRGAARQYKQVRMCASLHPECTQDTRSHLKIASMMRSRKRAELLQEHTAAVTCPCIYVRAHGTLSLAGTRSLWSSLPVTVCARVGGTKYRACHSVKLAQVVSAHCATGAAALACPFAHMPIMMLRMYVRQSCTPALSVSEVREERPSALCDSSASPRYNLSTA